MPEYQRISKSWVAIHPTPKGVIEFYGGAFFELIPIVFYKALLDGLYGHGYTIMAIPFRFGLDHWSIARELHDERDRVREILGKKTDPLYNQFEDEKELIWTLPHYWVGHSVGCKFIALLETKTTDAANYRQGDISILDEPAVFLAPNIQDTKDVISIPLLGGILGQALDAIGQGVEPTRAQTQSKIIQSPLFRKSGVIGFRDDDISGNFSNSPEHFDTPWFVDQIKRKRAVPPPLPTTPPVTAELDGGHLSPVGFDWGNTKIRLEKPSFPFLEVRREPDTLANEVVKFLQIL